MSKSYWKRDDLGVSEVYIALLENTWDVDLKMESVCFAAPYPVIDGSIKYLAVEFESFQLFCGDIVHFKGVKFVFLCARRSVNDYDATMCFLSQDAINAETFEKDKAPQTHNEGIYVEIKLSDFHMTSFSPLEHYEIEAFDFYYERLAALVLAMMKYDNEETPELCKLEKVEKPRSQQHAIVSPDGNNFIPNLPH